MNSVSLDVSEFCLEVIYSGLVQVTYQKPTTKNNKICTSKIISR